MNKNHSFDWYDSEGYDLYFSQLRNMESSPEKDLPKTKSREFFPIRAKFTFRFRHQGYRDAFAQDFSDHLIEWELWAGQELDFDPQNEMREIIIDSEPWEKVLHIFFEATGKESPGMLFKFFSLHPLIQSTRGDISLDITWGDGQWPSFHLFHTVGVRVYGHGFLPQFIEIDQNGQVVIDPCISVWTSPDDLHRNIRCIDDILTKPQIEGRKTLVWLIMDYIINH